MVCLDAESGLFLQLLTDFATTGGFFSSVFREGLFKSCALWPEMINKASSGQRTSDKKQSYQNLKMKYVLDLPQIVVQQGPLSEGETLSRTLSKD